MRERKDKMKSMSTVRLGFTIVELLIVIVVIAILAAISMVAYTGVQGRAKQAAVMTEVDKIGKAIQLWSAENGTTLRSSGAPVLAGRGKGMVTFMQSKVTIRVFQ